MNRTKQAFRIELHVAGAYWVRENSYWLPDWFIVRALNYVCDRLESFLDGTPLRPSLARRAFWFFFNRTRALGRFQIELIATTTAVGTKSQQWLARKIFDVLRGQDRIIANEAYVAAARTVRERGGKSSIVDLPRPACPKCGRSHPQLGTPLNKARDGWGDSFFTCTDCGHHWLLKKAFPALQEDYNGNVTIRDGDRALRFDAFQLQGMTIAKLDRAIHMIAASHRSPGVIMPLHHPHETVVMMPDSDSAVALSAMTVEQKRVLLQSMSDMA